MSNPYESGAEAKRQTELVRRQMEAVLRQLLLFAEMPLSERKGRFRKSPVEAFYQVPHPSGTGCLPCGAQGWEALGKIADVAFRTNPDLESRVKRSDVRDAVIGAFVKLVLREGREIDEATASLLLHEAIGAVRGSLADTEHHVPCVLLPGDCKDKFRIGPVTFVRRKRFFRCRREVLRRSIEAQVASHTELVQANLSRGLSRERAYTESESRQLVRGLHAQAIWRYRKYPWIASVRINGCQYDLSHERATRAVETALHAIRVVLGTRATKPLRIGWTGRETLLSAHLYTDAQGLIHSSLGWRSGEAAIDAGRWQEVLQQQSVYVDGLGQALLALADPDEVTSLRLRLLDGVRWFGDAATDSVTSSSIVKYVAAIERLLFGRFQQGRRKMFAARVEALLDAFGGNQGGRAYEQAIAAYNSRSGLLHGVLSPGDGREHVALATVEDLSRMCILCAVQLYPMIARVFRSPSATVLDEVMQRITTEGVEWLASAAGYEKSGR